MSQRYLLNVSQHNFCFCRPTVFVVCSSTGGMRATTRALPEVQLWTLPMCENLLTQYLVALHLFWCDIFHALFGVTFDHMNFVLSTIDHMTFGHMIFGHMTFRFTLFRHTAFGHITFEYMTFGHTVLDHMNLSRHLVTRYFITRQLIKSLFGFVAFGQTTFVVITFDHTLLMLLS